jgi:glycosyltransferase-like protein LARGE
MEAEATSCELKLLLFYELLGEEAATVLYPINCLRNAAMLAATTPLVAMVDVDLLISSTLAHDLMYRGGPPSSNAEARSVQVRQAMQHVPCLLTQLHIWLPPW